MSFSLTTVSLVRIRGPPPANDQQKQPTSETWDQAEKHEVRLLVLEYEMLTSFERLRIEVTLPSNTCGEFAASEEVRKAVLSASLPQIGRITGCTAIPNCDGVWCPTDGEVIVDVNTILNIDIADDEQAALDLAKAIAESAYKAYEAHGCPQQLIQINCIPIRQIVVAHAVKPAEVRSTKKAAA